MYYQLYCMCLFKLLERLDYDFNFFMSVYY